MIRVGIAGCGRIADMHAPGYQGLQDARIYAVCDTNADLAGRRAKEWNAEKVYTDYASLLADSQVDAVEILTPQKLHEPMVVQAAAAGKHVALQKPMTIDLRRARVMIEAMKRAGKIFRITDNYLFYPPLVKLRELIAAGELGVPSNLRIKFISGGSGGWDVPAASWEWRMKEREEGRGMQTFDHGHHLWAAAAHLLGPVERVSAWIDSLDGVVDSPAAVIWKYKNQTCYGMCEYVHAEELKVPSQYYANDEWFEVSGSRGVAVVRRCTGAIDPGPPLSLFTSRGWEHFADIPSDWVEGFKGATQNFISAIKGEAEPLLSGQSAYEVLRFALAIQKSSRDRREVYLEELDAAFPAWRRWKSRRAERKTQDREGILARLFGGTKKYAPQAAGLTRALIDRFDASKVKDWSCVIGLKLTGEGQTAESLFGFRVDAGKASLSEGALPADAVLTITMSAGTWAAILLKKKRIETAFLQGKLKVEGRAEEALKLRTAFGL